MTKGDFVLINGEFLETSSPYLKENRSFMYGDGLFESIRVINGNPFNLENHILRLQEGAKLLSIDLPESHNSAYFNSKIKSLLEKNNLKAGARIRLSVFRNDGGYYKPENNTCSYMLTADLLPNNLYKINEEGLLVDVYDEIHKHKNILSNYKTSNALHSIMAGNFANNNALNDCFILNSNRHIVESISANIFLVSNGVLYTPPLSDGCIGGTMRMHVINIALKNNYKVYETSLLPQNLMVADEIFFTNAIQGIQWVGGYKSKRYFNKVSKNLLALINQAEANLKMDLKEN